MLKKKIAISIISVSVMAGTGIAAIPLLSRMLSAENLGRFFAFLGLISLLQVLDGLRPAIVFNINKRLQLEKNYREVFAEINRRFNYWVVPSLILILVLFTDFEPKVIALLSITYVAYTMMSLEWGLLEAKNDVNYPAITRALAWFLAYAGFVILAYCQIDISYCLVVMVLMYASLWWLYRRRVNVFYGRNKSLCLTEVARKDILSDVAKNIKIQLGAVLLTTADKIIFPQILGYSVFSHYAIQAELATKGYVVNSTIRRAIQPAYTIEKGKDFRSLISAGLLIFVIAVIVAWAAQFVTEYLLVLYAGPLYAKYAYLMPVLLLVFPLNILGTIGTIILHSKGDFGLHGKITMISSLIFIPIFVALVFYKGIVGAAIALAMSRVVDVLTFYISLPTACSGVLKKGGLIGVWCFIYLLFIIAIIVNNILLSAIIGGVLCLVTLWFSGLYFKARPDAL